MGSKMDKAKGLVNEGLGNAKQGVGKAVGNDSLTAKGVAQERVGEGQQAMGKIKGSIKDAL